jgi:hypothetical protein
MIVLKVVLVGMMAMLLVSCGQNADDASDATAASETANEAGDASSLSEAAEDLILRRQFEGELTQVQAGVHIQLKYDPDADAFVGVARNATLRPILGLEITVELDDGTIIGPSDPIDMQPGRPHPINLPADGAEFTTWSAQVTMSTSTTDGEAKTE